MHWNRWRRNGDPLTVRVIVGDRRARVLSYIDERGPDECWPWKGRVAPNGYAYVRNVTQTDAAHRVVYDLLVGSIPPGMTVDHRCHDPKTCPGGVTCPHRRCCNPAHLGLATQVENLMRGNWPAALNARRTHCRNGHPFDEQNTLYRGGKRRCRTCLNAWRRANYVKRKAAISAIV